MIGPKDCIYNTVDIIYQFHTAQKQFDKEYLLKQTNDLSKELEQSKTLITIENKKCQSGEYLVEMLNILRNMNPPYEIITLLEKYINDKKISIDGYELISIEGYELNQYFEPGFGKADIENDFEVIEPHEKPYLKEDSAYYKIVLEKEFQGEDISNGISTYAWRFKSGQDGIINTKDSDELNIFFLGTSTPPLFGIHNIDVCETGHVLCHAALQKAQQGKPSVLVKGIGTNDMNKDFPLKALEHRDIAGLPNTTKATVSKTFSTVKGAGADTRIQMVMEQYFIPNLINMLLKKPLKDRKKLTLNIAGHSRGAITSFIMADCANKFIEAIAEGKCESEVIAHTCKLNTNIVDRIFTDIKENKAKINMKICALDPVEGFRSMAGLSFNPLKDNIPNLAIQIHGIQEPLQCSYIQMPESVKSTKIFFAEDERRTPFRPTIPSFSPKTSVVIKRVPGKHGTLTGNFGDDGGKGQFAYPSLKYNTKFQDATVGLYDEVLGDINYFFSNDKTLPPLPRNTFRRISNPGIYPETLGLLNSMLDNASTKEDFKGYVKDIKSNQIGRSKETLQIELFEALMAYSPEKNILIYNCLDKEYHTNLVKYKKESGELKQECRKDSNAGHWDLDASAEDRIVYMRGKKVQGTVKWHESSLSQLSKTTLPDYFYNKPKEQATFHGEQKSKDTFNVSFQNFKRQIELIANTSNMSIEDKQNDLFDRDYHNLKVLMTESVKDNPKNKTFVEGKIAELVIDMDCKYHLIDPMNCLMKLNPDINVDEIYTNICDTQYNSLFDTIKEYGVVNLSHDETRLLINHVSDQMDRLQRREHIPGNQVDDLEIYDDLVINWNDEKFKEAQTQLKELKLKLDVKYELDCYIDNLDVYIKDKRTSSGQNTDDVNKLRSSLNDTRNTLDLHTAAGCQRKMEDLISDYKNRKSFQGIISSFVKEKPGSVIVLNTTYEQIKNERLQDTINRHDNLNSHKTTKLELDIYINHIQKHLATYNWTNPPEQEKDVLAKLKAFERNISLSSKDREQINSIVDTCIDETPPARTLTGTNTYLVEALLEAKKEIEITKIKNVFEQESPDKIESKKKRLPYQC